MALWTLFGLRKGSASTDWPKAGDNHGQQGVLGVPRVLDGACAEGCEACIEVCPTQAIERQENTSESGIVIDYGRCITCQRCVEVCPEPILQATDNWALGVRNRDDLRWQAALQTPEATELGQRIQSRFQRSLHIRHIDAGSCGGCESELQALNNPFYNLHRLGIFFTASPRSADLLLVTGSLTRSMLGPLRATWDAMPEPRWVMAVGTCAVSGGIAEGGYTCGHGLDAEMPVDVYLPGCPPNPAAIIHALLLLVGRSSQSVHAGRLP